MATLYPALGNPQILTPTKGNSFTLDELQTAIGGPVRLIRYSSKEILFVHAEGQTQHLPINEKMTELIGQDLLQACLGMAYLVGSALFCTNTEAGLSDPKRTRVVALCFWCQERVIELSHQTYRNSRPDWQRLGKYYTLKEVADWLSRIAVQTSPSQVHTEIEHALDKLALKKVHCLVGGIKKRDGGELVAWEAEGVIAQIDELVPKLWKLLSPWWRRSDKKHGQYYHVYHVVDHEAMLDIQVGIHRWESAQRTQFYREVALLKVEGPSPLQKIFRLINHTQGSWYHNHEVLWFQDTIPLHSICTGDIIVSLMSSATWIVDHVDFQPLASANDDPKAETGARTTQEATEQLESILKDQRPLFICFSPSNSGFQSIGLDLDNSTIPEPSSDHKAVILTTQNLQEVAEKLESILKD